MKERDNVKGERNIIEKVAVLISYRADHRLR